MVFFGVLVLGCGVLGYFRMWMSIAVFIVLMLAVVAANVSRYGFDTFFTDVNADIDMGPVLEVELAIIAVCCAVVAFGSGYLIRTFRGGMTK